MTTDEKRSLLISHINYASVSDIDMLMSTILPNLLDDIDTNGKNTYYFDGTEGAKLVSIAKDKFDALEQVRDYLLDNDRLDDIPTLDDIKSIKTR